MDRHGFQQQLEIKDLEINALLEITQAINNNVAEEALYKIFKFTALSNLKFSKLCLFVRDLNWSAKVNFGTNKDYSQVIPEKNFTELKRIQRVSEITSSNSFTEFDLVIPISHRGETISLLFVGKFNDQQTDTTSDERLEFLQALSNIMVVAIENRKLAKKEVEQEALRKEMEIASEVQHLLFPNQLPRSGKLILEASYLPHDRVGGDYYDFIPISEDRCAICIADVSGKGVSAALLMANFQASLRSLVLQNIDLEETVRQLNSRLMTITRGERFITCFLAMINLSTNKITYVNAGHNPPLLVEAAGKIQMLDIGSTILGAMTVLPFIRSGEVRLGETATLFCYTDGLTDTMNESGHEFGTQWITDYFRKSPSPNLNRLHQDVIIALDQFKGKNPYRDDITMLSCRINS